MSYCMSKWSSAKNLKRSCWLLDFTIDKFISKKTKRGLELVLPHHFCMIFEKKKCIFLTQSFINWLNSIAWLPLLLKILGNMCIVTICCSVGEVIYCVIKVNFCIKLFFYITNKQGKNCKYLIRLNELILWSSGLADSFVCKRFAVQTPLWSPEFAIQVNREPGTI